MVQRQHGSLWLFKFGDSLSKPHSCGILFKMEWRYIAGFFDGEGSLGHNGKGFRITIPQANLEVLRAIQQYCDVGDIIKVTKRKPHWKDSWVYYISTQKEVYYFLQKIKPWVIVKHSLVERVLGELREYLKLVAIRKRLVKKRVERSIQLRRRGLTYREIGRRVEADHSYIRRLILKHS